MKKIALIVLLFTVISGALFAQSLVLFENGQWNATLGQVKMTGLEDSDKVNNNIAKLENGAYVTTNGIRFDFEKPIDASAYKFMTIETKEKTLRELGNWVGGAIFIYHATSFTHSNRSLQDSPSNIAHYGFWGNNPSRNLIQTAEGNIQFNLTAKPTHNEVVGKDKSFQTMDLKNFAGFRVKKAPNPRGTITIEKITLHN